MSLPGLRQEKIESKNLWQPALGGWWGADHAFGYCLTQAFARRDSISCPSCCLQALCEQSKRGKWDKGDVRKATGALRVSHLFISSLLCILAGNRVKPTICLELPFLCRVAWRRRRELMRGSHSLNHCSYSPAKGELRDHESQEIKLAGRGRRLNLLPKQGLTLLNRHSGISNSPGHKGFKKVCARTA